VGIKRAWVVGVVALSFCSCRSAPSLRVDADVLDKITIENKLLLFDAENELNIAIDSRDQVVDEIAQIKDDIRRARKKQQVAERDSEVFADKGDNERAKFAALRAVTEDSRIEYLEAYLAWSRERLVKERARLIVAKAQFELAKARLVKKNNVPGASDIELADFEAQVEEYKEDVNDTDEDIAVAEAEMATKEEAWVAKSEQLAAATGGALGSRWLD
jgi:chromosome segregation ATPase